MSQKIFTWKTATMSQNQTEKIIRRASPKPPSVAERRLFSVNLGVFGVFRRNAGCFFYKDFTVKGIAWLVVFMLTVAASTRAGESVPYTLAQRTQKAEGIAVAEVESISSAWNDQGTLIFTYIELRVLEKIKGNFPGDQLVLRHLGGVVGNVESRVAGMPQFVRNEKVLVFLSRISNSPYFAVMDWLEGKKTIQRDVAGREVVHVGIRGEKIQPLKEYSNEIQSLLKQQ